MVKSEAKLPKAKAGGSDAKVKIAGDSTKKNTKQEEIKGKILKYMADVVTTEDTKDVSKQDIATACGFSSVGTHAFFYAWQALSKEKKVEKSGKKGCGRLTELGMQSVPEGVIVAAPQDNAAKKEFLLQQLQRRLKGKAPGDRIAVIVDVLQDGKPHTLDELCKATGWKGLNTKAFGYTMSAMKKQGLAHESSKTYTLTDKWFPEGRP